MGIDASILRREMYIMSDPTTSTSTGNFRERVTALLKDVYHIWITERPTQFAAALAYYAVFSFVPVIYIAFKVTDLITVKFLIEERFYIEMANYFGDEIASVLQTAVTNMTMKATSGSILGSVIGFAVLLVTASTLFFQLQHILNSIWQIPLPEGNATRAYVRNRLMVFVMLLGVILVLILSAVTSLVISFLGALIDLPGYVFLLNFIAIAGLATMSCAMIYKVFPNAKVSWREVWIGSVVFGISFTIGLYLAGILLKTNWFNSTFEAAGTAAIFLIGFYYIGQLFVLGAVVIRVYANLYGSGILPSEH